MVQYIDITYAIWGKNITSLKGKTNRNKPIHVVGDIVVIYRQLIKIYNDVFMTADIFFVNGIPSFIFLSLNITVTTVIHIYDIKAITVSKAFKEIYMFYLKYGF